MNTMLTKIAERLDGWVLRQNLEAAAAGMMQLRPCRIRLLGQMALLEQQAPLSLALTDDVDVYANYDHSVEQEFRRLLAIEGKQLDPVGHEVWMPRTTRYSAAFSGELVTLEVAELEAVLVSKALKAPTKNAALIAEYLAAGPSERFVELSKHHDVDLEQFV